MAILFIAVAMIVQFAISFGLEKEHVREVVEYKMQLAQKDFFYVLLGFHNAADEMRKYVLEHPFSERELLEATTSLFGARVIGGNPFGAQSLSAYRQYLR